MRIIIELPDDDAKFLMHSSFIPVGCFEKVHMALLNGTPLPKGHGDLIDKDHIITRLENSSAFFDFPDADIFDSRYGQGLKEAAIKVSEEKVVIPADEEDYGKEN